MLFRSVVAALFTIVFTGGLTLVIGLAIAKTIGFRISLEDEERGVDLAVHNETAYEFESTTTSSVQSSDQDKVSV